MYFLKKNFSSNLKDCGKIVAIIFLILIVVNIFMPRIEGLDGDDSGGDDSGSSNSFSDGSGVDMYKVPGSNNPVTSECDSPEALNEDVCDFPPNINSAADACRSYTRKKAEMKAISDSMDSIASMTPWARFLI